MQEYINGYIERKKNGQYLGEITIDGVDLGNIECISFKEDGKVYLWLKRTQILEYDNNTKSFRKRYKEPRWEAYLEKQASNGVVAYKGEFAFLRFKYEIIGVWDKIFGVEKQRLNLYVERLPQSKQTIINSINERRRRDEGRRDKA